jgi:hypothetical protein
MVFFFKNSFRALVLPAGASLCGMVIEQQRPNRVQLDRKDFEYLIKNPEYLKVLQGSLAPQKKEAEE